MGKSLDHITIKGYKSIRDMSLDLGALNVLIGANGSGKSNFISVFTLIRYIVENNLQQYIGRSGANSLLYFGQKVTSQIELNFVFGVNGYNCNLMPSNDDSLFFGDESYWFHNLEKYTKPQPPQSLGKGHKETMLYQKSSESPWTTMADHVLRAMKSWWVYHFHDTSVTAKMKSTGDINDNRYLQPDAGNLAAYLYLLQQTQPYYYSRIVKTIQLVAPFFEDFALRPNPLNPDKIRLEWREKGSIDNFSAAYLSDGTLRFMCLATLLLQPEPPTTLVIDEPELGLHPYAITLLASLLRQASHHTQIIVSTQSVSLVNQFKPENIIVVNRQDKQSTFTRCNEAELEHWLEDYSMGELWERNIIGGRPA